MSSLAGRPEDTQKQCHKKIENNDRYKKEEQSNLSVFCQFGKGSDTRQRERRTEPTHTHTHSLENESSVTSERPLVRRFIHCMFIHIIHATFFVGVEQIECIEFLKRIYDQDHVIPRRLQQKTGYHTEYIAMEEKK